MKDLKALHFPIVLPDIEAIALAAKARVCKQENLKHGGLHVRRRAASIRETRLRADRASTLIWTQDWYHQNFFFKLEHAGEKVERLLINTETVQPSGCSYQGYITKIIRGLPCTAARTHLRKRLDRWNLSTLPGHRVTKVVNACKVISETLPPRVLAAYLRVVCDGWCTRRRFQGLGRCRFGCGYDADEIKHYASCTVIREGLRRHFGILPATRGWELDCFLLLESNPISCNYIPHGWEPDRYVTRQRAIACYAVYRILNGLRHGHLIEAEISEAFPGFIREALRDYTQ